jgi:hypothetical protein
VCVCVCVCVVLQFELRVSCLLRCSTTWAMPQPFLLQLFFRVVGGFFGLVWPRLKSFLCLLSTWNYRILPLCLAYLLRWNLGNFLSKLVSNHNLPVLCLQKSWDYRHKPPCQALNVLILDFNIFVISIFHIIITLLTF